MPVHLYVLRRVSTGAFFVGSTSDLSRRLAEHRRRHSPHTRGRGPWELVYSGRLTGGRAAEYVRMIGDLMAETAEVYAQGATMAGAEKTVAAKLGAKCANTFPPKVFEESVAGTIQKAYRLVSGSTE